MKHMAKKAGIWGGVFAALTTIFTLVGGWNVTLRQAALSTVIQAARDGLTLELDARCVTKSNVGNMGLLAPTLDADGNIIPVTPPSGG